MLVSWPGSRVVGSRDVGSQVVGSQVLFPGCWFPGLAPGVVSRGGTCGPAVPRWFPSRWFRAGSGRVPVFSVPGRLWVVGSPRAPKFGASIWIP
ncbi:hypothetical protein HOLleu_28488 [Holothuria leucospilota]|uniref:Uncharacterized protein n=1 Tax=Holothuria leucospilota TaxID=206669 RepID=A0A9Q1H0X2_HOLLE|nr:hypothetical protein HOLleu_28488 [Holothuria leucospilota]